jgi:hypothetical protein
MARILQVTGFREFCFKHMGQTASCLATSIPIAMPVYFPLIINGDFAINTGNTERIRQ